MPKAAHTAHRAVSVTVFTAKRPSAICCAGHGLFRDVQMRKMKALAGVSCDRGRVWHLRMRRRSLLLCL